MLILPFHLSICVNNLESTRHFYQEILGMEERRATKSSVHFDFFGSQLTCHHLPGFNMENLRAEVDAEDVRVPHFGAALTIEDFNAVKQRLEFHGIKFVVKPDVRFIGKNHEQHVMFLEDPSGYGIELKSFTKAPVGVWA